MTHIELVPGIHLIAAVGKSGQVGLDGVLPWRDPADLKWFKSITSQCDLLIVGHNTAQTLPPLYGRAILNDQSRIDPLTFLSLFAIDPATHKVMIIGGPKTYQRWLSHVRHIFLTKVDYDGPADAFMPDLWEDGRETLRIAKLLYDDYVNNGPIHSNRMPSWDELNESSKQSYIRRAKRDW